MPNRTALLAAFALLALPVAGCGDDDGPTAQPADTTDTGTDTGDSGDDTSSPEDTADSDATADQDADAEPDSPWPATPVPLVEGMFGSAEGLAFNGEGELFIVADTDLWRVDREAGPQLVADLVAPVGLASIGGRDILVAEFGPLAANRDGANDDGSILRVTPEGEVSTLATGIGDPNFIHRRENGDLLVSDDFTDLIYKVTPDGTTSVFLQGLQSPNGLVESPDGTALYVAQTFTSVSPLAFDRRVWTVPLDVDGSPGTPELLAEFDGVGANDGVALDADGQLYVAANADGRIWRIDPATGEVTLIAEGMFGVASLAFGEGAWTGTSLYATQLFGGRVWEVPVGEGGAHVWR